MQKQKQKLKLPQLPQLKYFAKGGFDVTFLLIVMILLTVGLVMLFSSSYSYALFNDGDSLYYIKRQLLFAALGVVMMFFVSKINFEYFKYLAIPGIAVSLLLLLVVLAMPSYMGVKRWISVPLIGTFQPSEIAKIGLILFMAWAMDKYHDIIKSKEWAVFPAVGLVIMFSGLVFAEHHFSGAILMCLIGVTMMYLGGFRWYWFAIGAIVVTIGVIVVVSNPNLPILQKYMGDRIIAWRNKDYSPMDKRWQINQSLYAIGSGGFLGQGLGESKQKHLYVSEPQNDFIFSIVSEELGFVGAVVIIILFALLVWRGCVIAIRARNKFGCLLAMGIVFQVGLQSILNILVVTDTIPNTGISLPFFSSGGTFLVLLLCEMGVVLSISRYSNVSKN